MPRLIDDIRTPGARIEMPRYVESNFEPAWAQMCGQVCKLLTDPDLPVLLIDNVADYYFGADQEYWDLRRDFPNLAPPYPMFWAEHRIPRKIHSKECGDSDMAAFIPHGRIGVFVCALDPRDAEGEGIPAATKWILWCELFIDYGEKGITAQGPHGTLFLAIDADGAVLEQPSIRSYASTEHNKVIQGLMAQLHPTFLAISFLHCRNVSVVDNQVSAPLARKYQRKTGITPTPYKTLIIEPLRQVLRHEGRSHEVGVPKALHICRGHFRDYREGRGLFGKYHQLVWSPATVRGSRGEAAPPREVKVKV